MTTKEIKINIPEGMEIDKENSTFECIKFKPIQKRWRYNRDVKIGGYLIDDYSNIINISGLYNNKTNYNTFATKKQTKSALAMARISQIMANDIRFGGPITDEEWKNDIERFCITRLCDDILPGYTHCEYKFLAFHTKEQRDLFLEENKDLVKDYLMID